MLLYICVIFTLNVCISLCQIYIYIYITLIKQSCMTHKIALCLGPSLYVINKFFRAVQNGANKSQKITYHQFLNFVFARLLCGLLLWRVQLLFWYFLDSHSSLLNTKSEHMDGYDETRLLKIHLQLKQLIMLLCISFCIKHFNLFYNPDLLQYKYMSTTLHQTKKRY